MSSRAPSALETNASPPTNRAVAGTSCKLKKMIFVEGASSFICAAVSKPDISPASMRSRITASGLLAWTSATAVRPSFTSAQISHSGLCASRVRIPIRTISWSSATRIRKDMICSLSGRVRYGIHPVKLYRLLSSVFHPRGTMPARRARAKGRRKPPLLYCRHSSTQYRFAANPSDIPLQPQFSHRRSSVLVPNSSGLLA